jgi:hypothetical protein
MIGIHPIHRRLAEIIHMSMDNEGAVTLGMAELTLIVRLLRQNLALVQRLDELKQLAFVAHLADDSVWEQDICKRIDELEVSMV